jgi:peroxiredoxin Q/BCP
MRLFGIALVTSLAVGCSSAPSPRAGAPRPRAPEFTLADTEGNTVALKDLLARGPVILAFFPKAFTAG